MTRAFDPARLRRAYVLGLGLSGGAAARLLASRGVEVVGSDRRPAAALELGGLADAPGVELRCGVEESELPAGVEAVVVSPGVALDHPLLAAARAAAERIGFPVAVKTAALGVQHKSDVGGVRVGIDDSPSLEEAYEDLERHLGPQVVVADMAPRGVEVALGVVRDPQVGPTSCSSRPAACSSRC